MLKKMLVVAALSLITTAGAVASDQARAAASEVIGKPPANPSFPALLAR